MKNTSKLILLVGMSATGKSTYAKKKWEEDPKNNVIVSRDSYRKLLFGYNDSNLHTYYNRKDILQREKEVTLNMEEAIRYNLGRYKTVIIDDTNLKIKYINKFSKFNVPTYLKLFTGTIEECVNRDSKRLKQVGKDVIISQKSKFDIVCHFLKTNLALQIKEKEYIKYPFPSDIYRYTPNEELKQCVVVDIDGTIARRGDRSPYDMSKVDEDTEKVEITTVVKALKKQGITIVICTGRDGTGAEKSKKWLEDHSIPYDHFYIRKAGDMRADYVVKEEMWREIVKSFNIITMIDDRAQVINHARSLGFTVMDVANHTF